MDDLVCIMKFLRIMNQKVHLGILGKYFPPLDSWQQFGNACPLLIFNSQNGGFWRRTDPAPMHKWNGNSIWKVWEDYGKGTWKPNGSSVLQKRRARFWVWVLLWFLCLFVSFSTSGFSWFGLCVLLSPSTTWHFLSRFPTSLVQWDLENSYAKSIFLFLQIKNK